MINISRSIFNYVKTYRVLFLISILIILSSIFVYLYKNQNKVDPDYFIVQRAPIKEEVSVTGNVKPFSDVDLAFERGGRVASINSKVGDSVYEGQVLAAISNDDLIASLDQAKANLKIAQLQLGKIQTDQITNKTVIQNSGVDKAKLSLAQAKISLANAIKDSYTKADDAVKNKMYSLFSDPGKYNSRLSFNVDSFLQSDIENGRNVISDTLSTWYQSLLSLNTDSNLDTYYSVAKNNLTSIKTLLDKCATAVNRLSPAIALVTQTQIDSWKSDVSTARTSIDLAISALIDTQNQYKTAVLNLDTVQNDYSVQEVNVEQAQASIASAEAELAKSIVKSPIEGVITNIDAKVGEIVSANKNIISVISYGDYEVEAFVPEADISKVKIGNSAKTTLDAYGDSVYFDTKVIKIDPAATVIEGVPTYKVTFRFINADQRIKSGMTANLNILTSEKANVFVIPARLVYSNNGSRYVKVVDLNNLTLERKVEIGIRGSDGTVEIISGLTDGERLATSI